MLGNITGNIILCLFFKRGCAVMLLQSEMMFEILFASAYVMVFEDFRAFTGTVCMQNNTVPHCSVTCDKDGGN